MKHLAKKKTKKKHTIVTITQLVITLNEFTCRITTQSLPISAIFDYLHCDLNAPNYCNQIEIKTTVGAKQH